LLTVIRASLFSEDWSKKLNTTKRSISYEIETAKLFEKTDITKNYDETE